MKKKILTVLILLLLAGCGTNIAPKQEEEETDPYDTVDLNVDEEILDNSILTVYFSVKDDVERIADMLMECAQTSQFQIVPGVLYDDEDMDFENANSRVNRETKDPAFRPDISNTLDLLDQYDTLFILYPVWNDRVPNIICSFLDSYDLSDKKIITLAISDKEDILQDFSAYAYDMISERVLKPQADRNTLVSWLNGLDI